MALSVVSSGAGRPPGRRPGGGAKHWFSAPVLAWEFLRRNPDYRSAYTAWRRDRREPLAPIDRRWGLRFAADPALAAEEARVFWLPEVAPGVVLPAETRPADLVGGAPYALPGGELVRADDGLHLRTSWGLQMLVRGGAEAGAPLIIALSYDEHFRLRVRAVEALDRLSAGRPPPKSHLTAAQLSRLHRCLTALDGALDGHNYRTIAEQVFGGRALDGEAWKTASVRAATIRLVRAGRALMNGGYLKLLRGGL